MLPTGAARPIVALSRREFLSAAAGLYVHGRSGVPPPDRAPARRHQYVARTFPAQGQAEVDGVRHAVLTAHPSSGPGPDVIVLHEITGASDDFFDYTDTLVDAGFTVHCPVLFGSPFGRRWWLRTGLAFLQACHPWSQLECRTRSAHSRLNSWLVALAVDVSDGGRRKIGAIGMCLTGIQPLAMLRCSAVVAPVLCQPTVPFGSSERSARDLGLPPSDVDFALARIEHEPLDVLLIRYREDPIAEEARARRLVALIGPRLTFLELDGNHHSSLVSDPHEDARYAVVEFLKEKLCPPPPTA